MDFDQMLLMLPGMQPDELSLLQNLTRELDESEKKHFLNIYQTKRRDQQNLTILTIIGFFGFAGLQRFATGDIGLGILFLITLGFCGIGTIIDLINIRRLTSEYNQKQAVETAGLIKMTSAKRY